MDHSNFDLKGTFFKIVSPQRVTQNLGYFRKKFVAKAFKYREMEYIESSYYNTFYPFQNKHQIHQNMHTIKMCGYKNQNKVKIIKWTRLIETNRFL